MDYIEFLAKNDLSNSKITMIYPSNWTEGDDEFYSLHINGDYVKDDYRYFDILIGRITVNSQELKEKFESLNTVEHPVLKAVSATRKDKDYDVKLLLENNGREIGFEFTCAHFSVSGRHYRGFDYTNVYGTPGYLEMEEQSRYVFDEQYFREEVITELPDGFSLYERNYIHMTDRAIHARGSKCELRRDGKCIYAYSPCDNHHTPYKELILHSNGHRYYPFHIDLYGISYIDVDTLEVFNYIPRGYDNQYGAPNGESFIVTKVHYDPESNLVAYDGCYWAGPSDVMVGKLDDPLDFDPHLISVCEILDPDEEEDYPDVDFVSWDKEGITVKVFGDEGERTAKISFDELKKAAETQNKRCY
jgi:hypothetical protein